MSASPAETTPRTVNVARHLEARAREHPDHLAVVRARRGEPLDRAARYTFAELDRTCDRIAHGLTSAGLERGMRTALLVPPSLEFFALTFALFKVGAVPVFIDPGIGVKSLGACLGEAEPEAFIGIPKAQIARRLLGWARPSVRLPITVGSAPWPLRSGPRLADLIARAPDAPFPCVDSEPEETAAILFTSGSTGTPKGAVYPHRVFATQVELIREQYDIEPGEVDLPTFPLFALFDPALGMAAIIPEMDFTRPATVDPAHLVELIDHFEVTSMFGSPAVVRRLGGHVESTGVRLPSLRRVLSAGAPASPPALARLGRALSPGVQVHTPYGATECLPVSTIASDEVVAEAEATANGAGICVGRPFPRVEIRIIEISDEPIDRVTDWRELPTGEVGEICVTGPMATHAYYGRDAATRLAKVRDGERIWHRMGDLGTFDAEGRLWFCGRKSHRVETDTGRFLTIPCEGVFNAHPDVFRTALVGVDVDGERVPALCVELEPGRASRRASVRSELLELGRAHDHTRAITRILFHPAFPVDIRHNSKIFREQLAVWAARRVSSTPAPDERFAAP